MTLKLNRKIIAGFAFMSTAFWMAVFMDGPDWSFHDMIATIVFLIGAAVTCHGVVDLELGD